MASVQTPPLPPEIEAQASPEQARSVFAQQGLNQPEQGTQQSVQAVAQLLSELEQWTEKAKVALKGTAPQLLNHLVPILNAGMMIRDGFQAMMKGSGMARGSPEVQPQPPMNPAAGPPNPNAV